MYLTLWMCEYCESILCDINKRSNNEVPEPRDKLV